MSENTNTLFWVITGAVIVVGVFTLKNELIGLGTAQMSAKKIMESTKGIAVKIDSVIMNIDTYPRIEKKVNNNKEELN